MDNGKTYNWNREKNEFLKFQRSISFERIVFEIMQGNELDVYLHPNQDTYPCQKISLVDVDGYIYMVPFVESETEFFLKTIIPSRKATKQYRSKS